MMKKLLTMLLALCLCLTACAALAEEQEETEAAELYPFIDFSLQDQYGSTVTLADCAGKVVFLNFWATWCPYCLVEMDDIQALYEELGENQGDVMILGVATPLQEELDEAGINAFFAERGWTYPTLMDTSGLLFGSYGISSLPTTLIIRPDGLLLGGVAGALAQEDMRTIIDMGR